MRLSTRFEEALVYACRAHAEQIRKGTEVPYVSHLLAVAAFTLENGATENVAIAALLHDVVEDAGGMTRLDDVRARFGNEVAEIVLGCSDAFENPKPPWRERKESFLTRLRTASPSVLLVACCDKLHNARSVAADLSVCGDGFWERFTGGRDGTLWYYREVLKVFRTSAVPRRLVEELDRCIAEIHRLAGYPQE